MSSCNIKMYEAPALQAEEWRELQLLHRDAVGATLEHRSPEELDALVALDDPKRYYATHVDPNNLLIGQDNPLQVYARPRVAIKTDAAEGRPIGFAYMANNVSGASAEIRDQKLHSRLGIFKRYAWLREVAVHSDYQKQGHGPELVRHLAHEFKALQPVATYIWPKEIAFLEGKLRRIGFDSTGDKEAQPFGPDGDTVVQRRMQAVSIAGLRRCLKPQ